MVGPELDIVIPVYNEGENIISVVESVRQKVKSAFRILICYDMDEDTTLAALKTVYPQGLRELELVKNPGTGVLGAVIGGFQAGTAPAVVVLPADDTFNARIIDDMMIQFRQGADLVAASRFIDGGCMVGCPLIKRVLVRTAAFMLFYLAQLPTRDPTNGFRLYSRRVLNEITIESTRGWSFSLELLVKCHRRGWKVAEVPALWYEREKGKSRFKVMSWLPLYLRWFFYAFETSYIKGVDAQSRVAALVDKPKNLTR